MPGEQEVALHCAVPLMHLLFYWNCWQQAVPGTSCTAQDMLAGQQAQVL